MQNKWVWLMNTIYVNVAVNKEWTSRSFVKLKNFVLQQSSTPSNRSWWDLPRLEQNKCDLVERKQVLCIQNFHFRLSGFGNIYFFFLFFFESDYHRWHPEVPTLRKLLKNIHSSVLCVNHCACSFSFPRVECQALGCGVC